MAAELTTLNEPPHSSLQPTSFERYQLISLYELAHTPACAAKDASSIEKKSALDAVKLAKEGHVILRMKQPGDSSSLKPITSLAIAVKTRVSFVIRLPRYYNLKYSLHHVKDIQNSAFGFGCVDARLEMLTPLVGYTRHDKGISTTTPQKLPHIRLFSDVELAKKQYRRLSSKDGLRKPYMTVKAQQLLHKWNVQAHKIRFLEKQAFSVHHLTTLEEEFFNSVNEKLSLEQPNLCSY